MHYKYCPRCGTQYLEQNDPEKYICEKCAYVFYQNSKPSGSAFVTNDKGQLLLNKRKQDPEKGKWDIPGGFLNVKEHPIDGTIRELKEETGLDVEIDEFLGIFMDTYADVYPTLNIYYTAHVVSGELILNDEVEDLKWFDLSAIPSDVAFKNGKEALAAWLKTRK